MADAHAAHMHAYADSAVRLPALVSGRSLALCHLSLPSSLRLFSGRRLTSAYRRSHLTTPAHVSATAPCADSFVHALASPFHSFAALLYVDCVYYSVTFAYVYPATPPLIITYIVGFNCTVLCTFPQALARVACPCSCSSGSPFHSSLTPSHACPSAHRRRRRRSRSPSPVP